MPDATRRGPADRIALAAIVTESVLPEFELMRFSFELFHGGNFSWFIQCDRGTYAKLLASPNVELQVFTTDANRNIGPLEANFNPIVSQKMEAIGRAWNRGSFESVMYVDSDLVFTAPMIEYLDSLEGDVLLTPHYAMGTDGEIFKGKYGIYNSGFVLTRNKTFHAWWRHAFLTQPDKFTDQQCLDDAGKFFSVSHLSEKANVGVWRAYSPAGHLPHVDIPEGCFFLHGHFYAPLLTAGGILWRAFSNDLIRLSNEITGSRHKTHPVFDSGAVNARIYTLHCLQYLQRSSIQAHQVLFHEIVKRDPLELYPAMLAASQIGQQSREGSDNHDGIGCFRENHPASQAFP